MSADKGRVPKEKRKLIYLSWDDFDGAILWLVREIKSKGIEVEEIHGIPRGGLVVAVALSHALGVPLSEERFTFSENALVVDDTCDSGMTLGIEVGDPPIAKTATLYYNKTAFFKPDFYVWEQKPDEWIVFPWEGE
jgi:hypoxanthine phosphoribosyltransferase